MTDPSDASDRPDVPAGVDRRRFLAGLASAAAALPVALAAHAVANDVPPALRFDPVPTGVEIPRGESSLRMSEGKPDTVGRATVNRPV